jgi:hypothetical protein
MDKSQCVYRIPCEENLQIGIWGHRYNLREGNIDKSKLALHAFEEGHGIDWSNITVLPSEPNSVYRKYKEAAYVLYSSNPISQPNLDICPIWFPLANKELKKWIVIQLWFTRVFGLCRRRFTVSPTEGAHWVASTSHFNLLEIIFISLLV